MKRYNLKINGEKYNAYIVSFHENGAVVEVNGNKFSVEFVNDDCNTIPVIERTQKELPEVPRFKEPTAEDGKIFSPIPGVIVKSLVSEGDNVKKGQPVIILEAMKMESEIPAPVSGKVEKIHVKDKAPVQEGQLLASIIPDASNQPVQQPKPTKPQPEKASPVKQQPISSPAPATSAKGHITAPIPGTILSLKVKVGDRVNVGDVVMILEAMKMESEISSEYSGTVTRINFSNGEAVQEGDVMIELGD
ncbi:MAG: biotin/lipoyl-binding protein [Candidatus Cloacimonetes bacterium]|nr:biotin/lipoyl-binding protein [Candidatus Cloacimonadota bacterium]